MRPCKFMTEFTVQRLFAINSESVSLKMKTQIDQKYVGVISGQKPNL